MARCVVQKQISVCAEGAARETLEEAGARVGIVAPFAHFDIPKISQSYIFFRAKLRQPFTYAAVAPESTDVRLFDIKDIPWRKVRRCIGRSRHVRVAEHLCDNLKTLLGRTHSEHAMVHSDLVFLMVQLAFSAVTIALKLYVEDLERGDWRFHHGVVKKKEGSGPNEPGTFALKDYIGLQLDNERSPVTNSPEHERKA